MSSQRRARAGYNVRAGRGTDSSFDWTGDQIAGGMRFTVCNTTELSLGVGYCG